MIRRIKRWNKWRKHKIGTKWTRFLVLIGVRYSFTFECVTGIDKWLRVSKSAIEYFAKEVEIINERMKVQGVPISKELLKEINKK